MNYTQEQKMQFVTQHQNGESVTDICTATGIPKSTFYLWVKRYRNKILSVVPREVEFLKKRISKLEDIIAVLKTVKCTVSDSLQERLQALELLWGQFSVHTLSDALDVARGTLYNHVLRNKKDNNSYQSRRDELSEEIKQVYENSNQIFGAKKIHAVLRERGVIVSCKMVGDLMQEMNLFSIRNGAKKNYKKIEYDKKVDKVKLQFSAKTPNQTWVSDTTCFRLKGRKYYICVIIDIYSRKIVSYKISQKHSAQLLTAAFRLAYSERKPEKGLVFHSDRGTQYTAFAFRKLLKACHVTQSFSPTARPCHNAVMESFFSSMKKEELYRRNYHSVEEFKDCVGKYTTFYNDQRPHSRLRYRSPNAYESMYFKGKVKLMDRI